MKIVRIRKVLRFPLVSMDTKSKKYLVGATNGTVAIAKNTEISTKNLKFTKYPRLCACNLNDSRLKRNRMLQRARVDSSISRMHKL